MIPMTLLHTAQHSFSYIWPVVVSEIQRREGGWYHDHLCIFLLWMSLPSRLESGSQGQSQGRRTPSKALIFARNDAAIQIRTATLEKKNASLLLDVVISHCGQQSPKRPHSSSQRQSLDNNSIYGQSCEFSVGCASASKGHPIFMQWRAAKDHTRHIFCSVSCPDHTSAQAQEATVSPQLISVGTPQPTCSVSFWYLEPNENEYKLKITMEVVCEFVWSWIFTCEWSNSMWPLPSMQFCLGHKPWLPCYVVRLQGTTVMLDCALDLSTLLNFLPLPLVYRWTI